MTMRPQAAAAPVQVPAERYLHKKTGGTYEVIARAFVESDLSAVIVYRSELNGQVWTRPLSEFMDGRFELIAAAPQSPAAQGNEPVNFYEREFYPLSNFSAFNLQWTGLEFPTSEHAYHWEKFNRPGDEQHDIRVRIRTAPSAHEAFKLAERMKAHRRDDWDAVKIAVMRRILRAKADQHEYVRRKLLETGDRPLIEMSWRDDFWGWGPNRDGQNMLGKMWMEIRAEFRASQEEQK